MRWTAACALVVTAGLRATALAVSVRSGFTAIELVTGLAQPTAAAFTPDGRLLVLEKAGRVRVFTDATGLAAEPLLTLPVCTASEMGLLGIAVDAGFLTNGFVYLYYTHPPAGDVARCDEGVTAGRVNRVARVTVGADTIDPASLAVLVDGLRTDNGNHDGGGLRIGPDGLLYVAVGDTGIGDGGPPGASTNPYARDLQRREGKILRVNLDGTAPPDNPFAGGGGDAGFVYASGFRNPFRFAFDPIVPGPRLLWAADVGQTTWEEVDVVRAGDDLGWPRCEGPDPTPECPGPTVPPVYVYSHPNDPDQAVSITGGVHYDGAQLDPSFRGDYFFGDFGLDEVYRLEVNAARDGVIGPAEVFSTDAGAPVDFFVGPDGALYWVAIAAGSVVRMTQDGRPGAAIGGCERRVASVAARAIARAGKRLAGCLRRGRAECTVVPGAAMRRRLARQIGRSCDDDGRLRLCARLGCGACAGSGDLVACATEAAVAVATAIAPLAQTPASACRTAAARAIGRTGGARLDAVVECAERGGTVCVPPPDAPPPSTKGLARACAAPSADVCAAADCVACATAADLATCIATRVAGPIDGLASAILGVVR